MDDASTDDRIHAFSAALMHHVAVTLTFFHLLKLNYASFRKSNFLPVSDDGEQACLSLTLQIFNLLTVMVKVPLQIFL